MKKIIGFLTLSFFLIQTGLVSSVSAAEGAKSGKYKRKYGMAGCGLGTYVIQKDDMGGQLGVALVHYVIGQYISFASPTWAMSSGTSNCVPDGQQTAMEQEVYLDANYASLSKEAAAGQGTHLDGLAEVLGCQDKAEFAKHSQNQYGEIFKDTNSKEVLNRYRESIQKNENLKAHCDLLG